MDVVERRINLESVEVAFDCLLVLHPLVLLRYIVERGQIFLRKGVVAEVCDLGRSLFHINLGIEAEHILCRKVSVRCLIDQKSSREVAQK